MKNKKKIIPIILIIVLILIYATIRFGFSTWWCMTLKGGRVSADMSIIDNSGQYPVYGTICQENEKNVGSVFGMACSCICCVEK